MEFKIGEFKGLLPGPAGLLEVITTRPQSNLSGVAIICHPHPLHQGTMHNKVVTVLAKTLMDFGLATVRFNYRGVGQSEGGYGNMLGEIEDLLAVKNWVLQELPGQPIWLAGFSFGAFIASSVAAKSDDVVQLISVAPAVHHADYGSLTEIACPWLVVQGEKDEVVPFLQVKAFAEAPPAPLTFATLPETGHFFHGKLLELRQIIVKHLSCYH